MIGALLLGWSALAAPLDCEQARGMAGRATTEHRANAGELRRAADELCGGAVEAAAPEGRVVVAVIHPTVAAVEAPDGECGELAELRRLGGDVRLFADVLARCATQDAPRPVAPKAKATWTFRDAALTSGFGWRKHPILKKRKFHHGLDLAARMGEPIPAIAAGKVVWTGDRHDGYGEMVELVHPSGAMTRYGHNSEILVSIGDEVTSGQAIAKAGSTGLSTGPHVHFEVRVEGEAVDPRPYVRDPRKLE